MIPSKIVDCAGQMKRYDDWLIRAKEMHSEFAVQGNLASAWSPVRRPLNKSRIALISTAGVHLKVQEPYDLRNPAGDPTYRSIPDATAPGDMMLSHAHIDTGPGNADIDCVFPLTTLHQLVQEGRVGSAAPTHFGFMGFIPHAASVIPFARQVTQRLVADQVDAVLLTPG